MKVEVSYRLSDEAELIGLLGCLWKSSSVHCGQSRYGGGHCKPISVIRRLVVVLNARERRRVEVSAMRCVRKVLETSVHAQG